MTEVLTALVEKHRGFPIAKQGELDYLCGVYCVLAAAEKLQTKEHKAEDANTPLNLLRRKGSALTQGMWESHIRDLAERVGLAVGNALNHVPVRPMDGQSFVLVFVAMDFIDPEGRRPAYRDGHYLLLIGGDDEHWVVADPHPWHPRVYCVAAATMNEWFMRAKNRWAAVLTRANAAP